MSLVFLRSRKCQLFETQDTKIFGSYYGNLKSKMIPVWSKKNKIFKVNGRKALKKDWKADSFIQQVFLECHDEPGPVPGLNTIMVNKAADTLEGRTDNKQDKYVKYTMARFFWDSGIWAMRVPPGQDNILPQMHLGLKTGGLLCSQPDKRGQSQVCEKYT